MVKQRLQSGLQEAQRLRNATVKDLHKERAARIQAERALLEISKSFKYVDEIRRRCPWYSQLKTIIMIAHIPPPCGARQDATNSKIKCK